MGGVKNMLGGYPGRVPPPPRPVLKMGEGCTTVVRDNGMSTHYTPGGTLHLVIHAVWKELLIIGILLCGGSGINVNLMPEKKQGES